MKYYTETIPPLLAEKLKENGMPIITRVFENYLEGGYYPPEIVTPTYADIFDWLMEKGIVMEQIRLFGNYHIRPIVFIEDTGEQMCIKDFCKSHSWHEAANAAIEKAVEEFINK